MIVSAALLRAIPLFSTLSDSEIQAVLKSTRQLHYPKDSVVFHEGDRGDALLVVLSGRVKVLLSGARGQEIILSILERIDAAGVGTLVYAQAGLDRARHFVLQNPPSRILRVLAVSQLSEVFTMASAEPEEIWPERYHVAKLSDAAFRRPDCPLADGQVQSLENESLSVLETI